MLLWRCYLSTRLEQWNDSVRFSTWFHALHKVEVIEEKTSWNRDVKHRGGWVKCLKTWSPILYWIFPVWFMCCGKKAHFTGKEGSNSAFGPTPTPRSTFPKAIFTLITSCACVCSTSSLGKGAKREKNWGRLWESENETFQQQSRTRVMRGKEGENSHQGMKVDNDYRMLSHERWSHSLICLCPRALSYFHSHEWEERRRE